MAGLSILEALKAEVEYPLNLSFFQKVAVDRGLDLEGSYTKEVGSSSSYKGAVADCLIQVTTGLDRSEDSVSLSVKDLGSVRKRANDLYAEIGEKPKGVPTVTFL